MARITGGRHTLIPDDIDCNIDLTFGSFCSIASGLTIVSGQHPGVDSPTAVSNFPFYEHQFSKDYPESRHDGIVDIGSDVWIGQNVTIMEGVVIGHGATIGAGSMVVKDVPRYAVVAGNPAEVKKVRFSDDVCDQLTEMAWWDWTDEEIKKALPLMTHAPLFLKYERKKDA